MRLSRDLQIEFPVYQENAKEFPILEMEMEPFMLREGYAGE